MGVLALTGFSIWLGGAVGFKFGAQLLLESGPAVLAAVLLGTAVSVCLMLGPVLKWRKIPASEAAAAAVPLVLPGLFADAAFTLAFPLITGRPVAYAGSFAAVIIFGNAALLAYALWMQARATRAA